MRGTSTMNTSPTPPVTPVGTANKRRRAAADKITRRFAVKDIKRKEVLPVTVALSKKTRNVNRGMRIMAFIAFFFICLSTVSVWRRRRRLSYSISLPKVNHSFGSVFHHALAPADKSVGEGTDDKEGAPNVDHVANDSTEKRNTEPQNEEPGENTHSSKDGTQQSSEHSAIDAPTQGEHDATLNKASKESEKKKDGGLKEDQPEAASEKTEPEEKHSSGTSKASSSLSDSASKSGSSDEHSTREKERLEFYNRHDFKEGTRPICRISNPVLLSNGTFLLPDWMKGQDRLLKRCALGSFAYYSGKEAPSGVSEMVEVDNDFALTIHQERFQEPTHDASIYLTEHILKASYLFDVFSGNAHKVDGVEEHHCFHYPDDSKCDLKRPPEATLKPGIFVPRRIETGPADTWTRKLIDMFGKAHGGGNGVVHLNASSMLFTSHAGRSKDLVGTRFRSVMTFDGMFRHMPVGALRHSGLYSEKNSISRNEKVFNSGGKCRVKIGIAKSPSDTHAMEGAEEFQEKLKVLVKFAVPNSKIDVTLVELSSSTPFESHVQEMQEVDVYLAGSGNAMSSIGFMHPSGTAIELMPFGYKPNTHESLAQVLGLTFDFVGGKPQDETFRTCIDAEIFHLRKKGKLQFTENPSWKQPLLQAWEAAVGEYMSAGSTKFNVLKLEGEMRNFHSRACAQKQKVEVDHDEAARKVIEVVKGKCEGKKSG